MARLYVIVTRTKSSSKSRPHFRVIIYNLSAIRQSKTIQLDNIPECKFLLDKKYFPNGTVVKKIIEVKKEKMYKYVIIEGLNSVAKKVVKVKEVKNEIEIKKAVKIADILCNRYELVMLIIFILTCAKSVMPQLFRAQSISRKDISVPYAFLVTVPDGLLRYFSRERLVKVLRGLSNGYYVLYLRQFKQFITPEKAFVVGIVDLLSS